MRALSHLCACVRVWVGGFCRWVCACVCFFVRLFGVPLVELTIRMRSSVGVLVGDRILGWAVGWCVGSCIWSST